MEPWESGVLLLEQFFLLIGSVNGDLRLQVSLSSESTQGALPLPFVCPSAHLVGLPHRQRRYECSPEEEGYSPSTA
ncbi:hypothetical protein E5288_WYG009701 [Bos mutus]|uniref:Secreted protein n=1 Tax=Bos mutus TaxID=72004 RepID=A0A6B0R3Z6_9CETA|nr:hypothetical protein [Bos mutus]